MAPFPNPFNSETMIVMSLPEPVHAELSVHNLIGQRIRVLRAQPLSAGVNRLERRRRRALELVERGLWPGEVAERVGVDRSSVRRWKAAYREKGPEALKAKPVTGRPPKLTQNEKQELEELLLVGAEAAGFDADLWTCPRVAKLIRKHFGVRYHVDHIGRLLRSLGWSPQRPQRRALERDEARIRG